MLLTLLINDHKLRNGNFAVGNLDNDSVFFMNDEWYLTYTNRPSLVVSLSTTTANGDGSGDYS